ncbi:MAG TPA: hypothetical protein VNX68_04035, partial [Nitrosopumilaceae archaeon]|nr:hypothetical protein [Nitrosopumilaceae archaeon]
RAPLIVTQLIEASSLLYWVKKNKMNKFHYFCIFETDCNICAYLLMKSNVYVNKIPSEVPLGFYNKVIISDSLSICFKYQEEEVKNNQDTMFIDKLNYWAPELTFTVIRDYTTLERNVASKGKIGFYSSACWLRKMNGAIDLGENDFENEEVLLVWLFEYIKKNPKLSLTIFLHPMEKKEAIWERTKRYYDQFKSLAPFSIADIDKKSIEYMDEVDLGVSRFSTVMFERIFWGFKTILSPMGNRDFPIRTSSFSNICIDNKEELFAKLDKNIPLSEEEYFKLNEMPGYTFSSIPYFSKRNSLIQEVK